MVNFKNIDNPILDPLNIFPEIKKIVCLYYPNTICCIFGSRSRLGYCGSKFDFDVTLYNTNLTNKDIAKLRNIINGHFKHRLNELGKPVKVDLFRAAKPEKMTSENFTEKWQKYII